MSHYRMSSSPATETKGSLMIEITRDVLPVRSVTAASVAEIKAHLRQYAQDIRASGYTSGFTMFPVALRGFRKCRGFDAAFSRPNFTPPLDATPIAA